MRCVRRDIQEEKQPADGVAAARRGQKTPTGYYNGADMLSELIAKGVKVKT
jgi:hypothetical protein